MFDIKQNPLACEGIIGDGCGGGRWFFIENDMLKTYDPQTKESMVLLADIANAIDISKKGCIITIKCSDKIVEFNLSTMNHNLV